jgi:4'-phosphopantetheinyl transferase
LGPGNVDLWVTQLSIARDKQLFPMYRSAISESERARAALFRFDSDQERFIATRMLIRTVLSRYCGVRAQDLRFGATQFGRPYVLHEAELLRLPEFNLSHTNDLVILVVGFGVRLGVDVESISRCAPPNIATRWFSLRENADIDKLPPEIRGRRFFELWTLKECFVKAHGAGLTLPLEQFEFDLNQKGRIGFKLGAGVVNDPSTIGFWQFPLQGNHIAAMCSIGPRIGIFPFSRATLLVPNLCELPLMLGPIRSSVNSVF